MAGRCCGTLLGFTGRIAAALCNQLLQPDGGFRAWRIRTSGWGACCLKRLRAAAGADAAVCRSCRASEQNHLHVEIVEHILEEVERLYLVDYQRILLLV